MSGARAMDDANERALVLNINARVSHCVFDLSGAIAFDIFYVAVRRTRHEIDPRPLLIQVAESLFDIPYALKHGLLKIFDLENEGAAVDFSDIKLEPTTHKYFIVDSGANANLKWYYRTNSLQFRVHPNSSITAKLQSHHKYRVVLPLDPLGIQDFPAKYYRFIEPKEDHSLSLASSNIPDTADFVLKLRRSHIPDAEFTVLPSLRMPPPLKITLTATSELKFSPEQDLNLRVEILNLSSRSITVKSRGGQRYLVPNGVLQPDWASEDTRITYEGAGIPKSCISICRTDPEEELVTPSWPVCDAGRAGPILRRLYTTLAPDLPFVKEDSLKTIFPRLKLEQGQYRLKLVPKGVVWHECTVRDIFQDAESMPGPEYRWEEAWVTPPLMLQSDDAILFSVVGDEEKANDC